MHSPRGSSGGVAQTSVSATKSRNAGLKELLRCKKGIALSVRVARRLCNTDRLCLICRGLHRQPGHRRSSNSAKPPSGSAFIAKDSGGLWDRPAFPFAPRRSHDFETAGRDQSTIPEFHRGWTRHGLLRRAGRRTLSQTELQQLDSEDGIQSTKTAAEAAAVKVRLAIVFPFVSAVLHQIRTKF